MCSTLATHLAGQRGDVDTRAFPLENVTERLKVRVSPAHNRVLDLERGDVGLIVSALPTSLVLTMHTSS